jgi:hypothetical protein
MNIWLWNKCTNWETHPSRGGRLQEPFEALQISLQQQQQHDNKNKNNNNNTNSNNNNNHDEKKSAIPKKIEMGVYFNL